MEADSYTLWVLVVALETEDEAGRRRDCSLDAYAAVEGSRNLETS